MNIGVQYDPSDRMLVIDSPDEKTTVRIMLTAISGKQNALLLSGNLSAGRTCFRLSEEAYPPGTYIVTWKEGAAEPALQKNTVVP